MTSKELKNYCLEADKINENIKQAKTLEQLKQALTNISAIKNTINSIKTSILDDKQEEYNLNKKLNKQALDIICDKKSKIEATILAYRMFNDTKLKIETLENVFEQTIEVLDKYIEQIEKRIEMSAKPA